MRCALLFMYTQMFKTSRYVQEAQLSSAHTQSSGTFPEKIECCSNVLHAIFPLANRTFTFVSPHHDHNCAWYQIYENSFRMEQLPSTL
mmetsp:Transcript_35038/g.104507  ORF Transcript_35038/g.104507 Transcript_35038/m.104507 type:complete len:88 (-) Transcript_35038:112-375(-)